MCFVLLFLFLDLWVYVGSALGTLVLIFLLLFIVFLKLKSTSSAHTTLNFTSRSESLIYSTVLFMKQPHTERKSSRDPNERIATLYSSVHTTGVK